MYDANCDAGDISVYNRIQKYNDKRIKKHWINENLIKFVSSNYHISMHMIAVYFTAFRLMKFSCMSFTMIIKFLTGLFFWKLNQLCIYNVIPIFMMFRIWNLLFLKHFLSWAHFFGLTWLFHLMLHVLLNKFKGKRYIL